MSKRIVLLILLVILIATTTVMYVYGRSLWVPAYQNFTGKRSVSEAVDTYGPDARERMSPYFTAANIAYPPGKITLLALKDAATLELWAETENGPRLIRAYPIQALSGISGPKLREGDGQVPEGIYSIEGLNPNSAYHLSMKLNYPNKFDLKHAQAEGRTQPGTNIFIHGKAVSIGCLAMGDPAIEELFVLAADIGSANIQVAIAPHDPRSRPLPTDIEPVWVSTLYGQLNVYFERFKRSDI